MIVTSMALNLPDDCMHLKTKRIIFSAQFFTAINPSHRADVGKTLARFIAPIILKPVFIVMVLPNIELGISDYVGFFVFIHGAPLSGGADPSFIRIGKLFKTQSRGLLNTISCKNQQLASANFKRIRERNQRTAEK
jgi:hypothetical protein